MMSHITMSPITRGESRTEAQVTFPDGRIYRGAVGSPLSAFTYQAEADAQTPRHVRAVAALVDNRLRELTYTVKGDLRIQPITLAHSDGTRIYRRSLSFLLIVAAQQCFPDAEVIIDHALPERAYFCHVENHPPFTPDDLALIEAKMRELVAADLPIARQKMSIEEARQFFLDKGDLKKVDLLQYRHHDYLNIYTLEGFSDYFFGYMTPSTGYLEWFALEIAPNGFLLRYPTTEHPGEIVPMTQMPKLDEIFTQTNRWLNLLGLTDFAQLNDAIQNGRLRELVLIAEALHERRIAEIGQQIAARHHSGVRLVLISGPSSSGKTTFSKRLAIQLLTHGLKPFTLEMDNYFVDRELTPRDEKGEYDFESLGAINLDLFQTQLAALIQGEAVQLPRFDFPSGRSVAGTTVQLTPEHVIIIEGIHGLNPALTEDLAPETYFRAYVSALTQLNIDRYNRISTTDVRLLRRIVRDAVYRGWTASDTLTRWDSVVRGEKRNIFPYQENADVMFNSALFYELAILRPFAEPHLLRVEQDHPKRAEARRLLAFLSWVLPASPDTVPDNSLLREFVGGSILHDYHPG